MVDTLDVAQHGLALLVDLLAVAALDAWSSFLSLFLLKLLFQGSALLAPHFVSQLLDLEVLSHVEADVSGPVYLGSLSDQVQEVLLLLLLREANMHPFFVLVEVLEQLFELRFGIKPAVGRFPRGTGARQTVALPWCRLIKLSLLAFGPVLLEPGEVRSYLVYLQLEK